MSDDLRLHSLHQLILSIKVGAEVGVEGCLLHRSVVVDGIRCIVVVSAKPVVRRKACQASPERRLVEIDGNAANMMDAADDIVDGSGVSLEDIGPQALQAFGVDVLGLDSNEDLDIVCVFRPEPFRLFYVRFKRVRQVLA